MESREFYDVETKTSFITDQYEIRESKGRKFAVVDNPQKTNKCWIVINNKEILDSKK